MVRSGLSLRVTTTEALLDRPVYSQECSPGEPNRLNLHGFTRVYMFPEPRGLMRLHQCRDVEPSQLYSPSIRQIDNLESQPSSVSIKCSPAIHCNDMTIFPVGHFGGKELQAVLEIIEESPWEAYRP